ncbi:MAG: glutamine amidotransferase class-I [bacterium]|nr:MAG: glutamine amidotransferase class-I [bacterium]KAF0149148.1 MAG: glutamine amidotransferase class-I [bacterium]KAF0168785.1 MAG: glutamine amidotransferase class-I [bacterium]TXT20936.1 MAG: glutamine amidotransferase class-I [bacterium]
MKPIAIFRHAASEGPGHFARVIEARQLPWRLIAIDAGDAVPARPDGFSGLVFMGGPMSVNDPLPWIPPLLELIRAAVARDIPVLGHCLGGQLIAKALGGVVGRNPVQEIGWGEVRVADSPEARAWFGDMPSFQAFHWHGETFSLPPGAVHLLSSPHCANQAYALGKHLGLQCHVEMTEAMIQEWCVVGADELAAARGPAVQSAERMQSLAATHLPALQRCAEGLYAHWLRGLRA